MFASSTFHPSTGVRRHVYICADEETSKPLEEHDCSTPRPTTPLYTTCNLAPCPPRLGSYSFASFDIQCSARTSTCKMYYFTDGLQGRLGLVAPLVVGEKECVL